MKTPTENDLALLNTLRDAVGANAEAHGFRDQYRKLMSDEQWQGQLGALVRAAVYSANQHGEASEFWEAFRAGKLNQACDKAAKMEALGLAPLTCGEEELADELIRLLDKADGVNADGKINVARAVAAKMAYNAQRDFLHGESLPDDPEKKVLMDGVLDGLKQRVMFLVDGEFGAEGIDRLVERTQVLALEALAVQFGKEAAEKFFQKSENHWLLRTAFGGWVFFYPVDMLTANTSMEGLGQPDYVYWPDAEGTYARVPWATWVQLRERGNVWRPTSMRPGPKSVWERLRDP